MNRILLPLLFALPIAGLGQATTPTPADTAQAAAAPLPKRDSVPPADPAAYLRIQQQQVPGNMAQPGPSGAVQVTGSYNQQVLSPTGYQNNQGVGSTIEFKGKDKSKKKRSDD